MGREALFGLNCIFNQSFKKLNDFLLFSTNLVVMACRWSHLRINVRSVSVGLDLLFDCRYRVTDDLANEEDSLSGGDRAQCPVGRAELSLNWNVETNLQLRPDNKDFKISSGAQYSLYPRLSHQIFLCSSCPACLLDINERSIYLIFVVCGLCDVGN